MVDRRIIDVLPEPEPIDKFEADDDLLSLEPEAPDRKPLAPTVRPTRSDLASFLNESDLKALAEAASASPDNAHLRLEAAVSYIVDPSCSTVANMAKNEKFEGLVAASTLERWRRSDRWDHYRRKFFTAFLTEMTRAAGDEMISAKREELRQFRRLRDLAMAKATDPDVMPKSWEGVVRALVDISDRIDKIGGQINEQLLVQTEIKARVEDEANKVEPESELNTAELEALVARALADRKKALTAQAETPTEG